MIDPDDAGDYNELGDVISIYQCPECEADLRVEFREDVPAHAIGLACPHGHVGMPIRMRDAARLDEAFETRQPDNCYECWDEVHVDRHPTTDDGQPLHPGECADQYREDRRRLEALEAGSA